MRAGARGARGGTGLAGHLPLTPDLPTTVDFRRPAQGLVELVVKLRAGGELGPVVTRVVLMGLSAGGRSSLLAAATPGVVGDVGLDTSDCRGSDGHVAFGLDIAPSLKAEALLPRAPPVMLHRGVRRHSRVESAAGNVGRPCHGRCLAWQLRVTERDWLCAMARGAPDVAPQALVHSGLVVARDRW